MLYVGLNYGLFSTECGTVMNCTNCFFTCVLGTVILATALQMSYCGIILWHFFTFKYVARCTTQTIIKHIRITGNAHGKLSFTDMVILTSIHFSSKLTVSWQPSQVVNVSLQTVLVLKPLLLGSQESWITLRATLPNFIIYYTITKINYLQEVKLILFFHFRFALHIH